ncbi:hypothetical protein LCGC14_0696340 [marine sediment metagenome]|uniref:Uncharacterized protein n=1 Tax=marine sediment metagenome TaxID=412755 RepID=A0A0F9R4B7_9ZZZZ
MAIKSKLDLEDEYLDAVAKVNETDRQLRQLWDKGDFKKRNQIINSQWRNAVQKKNRAEKKYLAFLNTLTI